MHRLVVCGAALSGVLAAPLTVVATAQAMQTASADPAAVQVALGPAVQARADELGRQELDQQRAVLARDVSQALARSGGRITGATLAIVDIEPNRPTPAQLGRSPGLDADSNGLGGAAVTGEVAMADGTQRPIRYRFFQDQRRDELNFTTWGDADQAFDELASAIGRGRVPDQTDAWPPPHQARTLTGTRIPD